MNRAQTLMAKTPFHTSSHASLHRRSFSTLWLATCAIALALFNPVASAQTHWSYSGGTGPLHWAELSPEHQACAGSNQSPVDLNHFVEADLAPIRFSYDQSATEVVNNGHTVQVKSAGDSKIILDGRAYRLWQFHFHAPSEHHINGVSFPMEMHLVHVAADGDLAVVGVMFTVGADNAVLAEVWDNVSRRVDEKKVFDSPLAPADLLPKDRDYYRLNGSLTTPPCTEGVIWLVMKQPAAASQEQITALAEMLDSPNNRPVQPLNARVVLR